MTDIAPEVDPNIAAAPEVEGTEAAPPAEAEAGAEDGAPSEPKPEPKPKRDFQKERIDTLTRQREDARRDLEVARRETEAARALAAGREDAPQALAEAEIERRLTERLATRDAAMQQRLFQEETGRVLREGRERFPDFEDARASFIDLFGDRAPQTFYEAITDLPNGAEVFRDLGLNPELAERVMDMSPIKQALELGRLSALKGKPPTPISRVPAPIDTIRPGALSSRTVYDDGLDTKEWVAKRNADIAARKAAR